jgi:hypothetical protein
MLPASLLLPLASVGSAYAIIAAFVLAVLAVAGTLLLLALGLLVGALIGGFMGAPIGFICGHVVGMFGGNTVVALSSGRSRIKALGIGLAVGLVCAGAGVAYVRIGDPDAGLFSMALGFGLGQGVGVILFEFIGLRWLMAPKDTTPEPPPEEPPLDPDAEVTFQDADQVAPKSRGCGCLGLGLASYLLTASLGTACGFAVGAVGGAIYAPIWVFQEMYATRDQVQDAEPEDAGTAPVESASEAAVGS